MVSLRKKIGQLLIMGLEGTQIEPSHPVKKWLTEDGLGGVILFDIDLAKHNEIKNLSNLDQIIHLNKQLQTINLETLPLLIGIDYEGGFIDRLKNIDGLGGTLTPLAFAKLSDNEQKQYAHKMARTLRQLGFNLNFAPVVDLSISNNEGIIGKFSRSFSARPEEVIKIAHNFVQGFHAMGVLTCYKHFPGHGSAVGDSHTEMVDVTDTFQNDELEPYKALIRQKLPSTIIMTAHVINKKLDFQGCPATLSKRILHDLLRLEMGFEGIILTDDLQMQAISKYFGIEEALEKTLNAGADLIIFGNQLDKTTPAEIIDKIEKLVLQKDIPISRIDEAYNRICKMKHWLKTSNSRVC
jgi:beta-N-acetylhexosaminidase